MPRHSLGSPYTTDFLSRKHGQKASVQPAQRSLSESQRVPGGSRLVRIIGGMRSFGRRLRIRLMRPGCCFFAQPSRRSQAWTYQEPGANGAMSGFFGLKIAHHRANESALQRAFKKCDEKLERTFLGRSIVTGIGPWGQPKSLLSRLLRHPGLTNTALGRFGAGVLSAACVAAWPIRKPHPTTCNLLSAATEAISGIVAAVQVTRSGPGLPRSRTIPGCAPSAACRPSRGPPAPACRSRRSGRAGR